MFVLAKFYDLELENKTLSQFWIHKGNKELHLEINWIKNPSKRFSQNKRFNEFLITTNSKYSMNHNIKPKRACNRTWQFYFVMTIRMKNLPDGKKESKGDLWLALQKQDVHNLFSCHFWICTKNIRHFDELTMRMCVCAYFSVKL